MQVLVNLLQNAHDAVRDRRGHVVIGARADGMHVRLTIDDDGPGIPEGIEGRLFEPFTTTKPPGQGTGLGLYTSYMLAQAMGGTLTLERREEGGTRATVRLPAAAETDDERLAQVSGLTQRAG
jgi:two-component system sensor histidine kinase HupT/HoxJ